MRVRKRQEKKADETNRVTIKVHKQDIDEHIEGMTDKIKSLQDHQKDELDREYASKIAKTHAEIENKFNAK